MRSTILIAVFALTVPALAQDAAVKELEGSYTVAGFDRAGKPVPDEVRNGVGVVSISGGKLTLKAGGKELVATLKADAKKKPDELDLLPQGPDVEKGKKFPGLYKLEKGELTIVFVEEGERPKDFQTDAPTATKLVMVKK